MSDLGSRPASPPRHTVEQMRKLLEGELSLPAGLGREEGRTHSYLQERLAELGERLGYIVELEWKFEMWTPWREEVDRFEEETAYRGPGSDDPILGPILQDALRPKYARMALRGARKHGVIDVLFFRDRRARLAGKPSHAFEIDYNPKLKSIRKLRQLGPATISWIVVFAEKPRPARPDWNLKWIEIYRVRREEGKGPAR